MANAASAKQWIMCVEGLLNRISPCSLTVVFDARITNAFSIANNVYHIARKVLFKLHSFSLRLIDGTAQGPHLTNAWL